MTPAPAPLSLSEARETGDLGGKAVALGEAIRAGLPVPDGFALGVEFTEAVAKGDADAVAELGRSFGELGAATSVRSSGIGEDGGTTSFAGQHLTVLNVRSPEAAAKAVTDVWESAHSESALAYRELLGVEGEPRIAVIVQVLVEPDTAGVMFTRHPVTGADERVIDASWGLGEAVAGSIVTPDHFRLDTEGTVLERTPGRKHTELRILPDGGVTEDAVADDRAAELCLSDSDLVALHELASSCEAVYGGDQDIEWAITAGEVHLLQRRPLTAVG